MRIDPSAPVIDSLVSMVIARMNSCYIPLAHPLLHSGLVGLLFKIIKIIIQNYLYCHMNNRVTTTVAAIMAPTWVFIQRSKTPVTLWSTKLFNKVFNLRKAGLQL